jgi:hypothetical protein
MFITIIFHSISPHYIVIKISKENEEIIPQTAIFLWALTLYKYAFFLVCFIQSKEQHGKKHVHKLFIEK